ncbi:MAG: efflux RND transporter periplasmic adaptor subunit, partial [bacterium]
TMIRHCIVLALGTLALASGAGCEAPPAQAPGAQAAAPDGATCEKHKIAHAQDAFCHPELVETLGFCQGHGVPEAFCYQCNAALIPAFQAAGDWCAGHDRPESQCYICNPEFDPARKAAPAAPQGASIGAAAPTGDIPRTQRPPSVHCSTQDLVVQFESADIPRDAGLQIVTAEQRTITKTVECTALVAFDGDRHAHLSSQVPGVVAKVHRDLGDVVEAGAPLVTITSAELGAAKAAFLQAVAAAELWTRNQAREADLLAQGAGTERDAMEAETELSDRRIAESRARQELLRLGLSPRRIDEIAETRDTSPTYVLTAPFAGTVVERAAALGEVVGPDAPLVAVADVSRMWALLDVFESDIPDVKTGQAVVLRVEGLRGLSLPGEITWVAAHVDPRTRTLQARAEVENPGGALKANMFAQASIAVRDGRTAVVVPVDAVQWEGCCNIVFVKRSDVLYEPRKVQLGVATGTAYEVLDGLRAGEEIVTQGSFLLKTEILKGSIGAGCCEVEPGA